MVDVPEVQHIQMTCISHRVGAGVDGDPVRVVQDYFLPDGSFLQRVDAWAFGDQPYRRLSREYAGAKE